MKTEFTQFGERLVVDETISTRQLQNALAHQRDGGSLLGESLVELGMLSRDGLIDKLTEHFGVPYVELAYFDPDPDTVDEFPSAIARRFAAVPLFRDGSTVAVAVTNPNDILTIEGVEREVGCAIDAFFSQPDEIRSAIDRLYHDEQDATEFESINDAYLDQVPARDDPRDDAHLLSSDVGDEVRESGPIVRAVNLILTQAIRKGATDIHIEPGEDHLRVRFRIDGFLCEAPAPSKRLHDAIVSRLKVMSNLDISETRLPQDGHFKCGIDGRTVDVRSSIVPTVFGENVVLRVLDQRGGVTGFEKLGLDGEELEGLEEALEAPWGMILVTGPTGSGKTTTLYTALDRLCDPKHHVITIEDPIENVIDECRQIQINPKSGLTFARGLRAILRHDPDVVLVGEIRDGETAEIATQAALTGHLILSTLHTNDAPSAIARLIDLGVAPFLVEGALSAVLAQRLVRRLCPECRVPTRLDPSHDPRLRAAGLENAAEGFEPSGCRRCDGTGYSGRTGIYELMRITDPLRERIVDRANTASIREAAIEAGMRSLRRSGLGKVVRGITSFDEIVRVTRAL